MYLIGVIFTQLLHAALHHHHNIFHETTRLSKSPCSSFSQSILSLSYHFVVHHLSKMKVGFTSFVSGYYLMVVGACTNLSCKSESAKYYHFSTKTNLCILLHAHSCVCSYYKLCEEYVHNLCKYRSKGVQTQIYTTSLYYLNSYPCSVYYWFTQPDELFCLE